MAKTKKTEEFYVEREDGTTTRPTTSMEIHGLKYKEYSPAEVEKNGPETKNGIVVNSLHVKVRNKPSYDSDVLEVLRKGDKVTILGKSGEFYKVSTRLNKIAYISLNFIKEE